MSINRDQVGNALRHMGSFAAGAITLASVFVLISGDQAQQLSILLNESIDHLVQASDGIFKIVAILGPAIAAVTVRLGSMAVSTYGKMKSLDRVDGVKVVVGPSAPAEAQAAAANKDLPNIVPAGGGAI